jgi:hypothetical protein
MHSQGDRDPIETNMTGTARDPERVRAMMEATEEFPPSSDGDARGIAAVRVAYATAREPVSGRRSAVRVGLLMDKLGERLAFERAGTRLYEALLSKHEAYGSFGGGPSAEDLTTILKDEHEHFQMLRQTIEELGGDPTELTASANLQLTASKGIAAVVVDPRTTLLESLEVIALAELADNEGWEALAELARGADQEDLAMRCGTALAAEEEHLDKVRTWLAAGQGRRQLATEAEFEPESPRDEEGAIGEGVIDEGKSRSARPESPSPTGKKRPATRRKR